MRECKLDFNFVLPSASIKQDESTPTHSITECANNIIMYHKRYSLDKLTTGSDNSVSAND